jgi:hypothetical protein
VNAQSNYHFRPSVILEIPTQMQNRAFGLVDKLEKKNYAPFPTNAVCQVIEWMPREKEWVWSGKSKWNDIEVVGWQATIREMTQINEAVVCMRVVIQPRLKAARGYARFSGGLIEQWELSAGKGLIFTGLVERYAGGILTH